MNVAVIINILLILLFAFIAIASTIIIVLDRNKYYKSHPEEITIRDENDLPDRYDVIFKVGVGIVCFCSIIICLLVMSL